MIYSREALLVRLTTFFKTDLLEPEDAAALTAQTPLYAWGVFNSLSTARLIGFIREQFGVAIPLQQLTEANFSTLDKITDLVLSVRQDTPVT
ncbi:acyl carrier protein [Micromonospora sp. NPDC050200]|uniref:acyl carrier protein n=1 Tax=Micromonospora sp. NPDC050200 TaxID=3155664 RepID=UPI0033DC734E